MADETAERPYCPRCGRATDPNKRHQHWLPYPYAGFTSHLCIGPTPPGGGDRG